MAFPEQEIKVRLLGIAGVQKPFKQGGSMKTTIPPQVVKKYQMEEKVRRGYFALIWFETDKGVLLVPLDRVANPDNIKEALKFFDSSGLRPEEIELLLREGT